MTISDFYLDIARQELKLLEQIPRPASLGSSNPSEHFRHALVASIFSALAVERAASECILVKELLMGTLQESITPETLLGPGHTYYATKAKLKYLRDKNLITEALAEDVGTLFDRRDRLVHLKSGEVSHSTHTIGFEEAQRLIEHGKGAEIDSAIESALYNDNSEPLKELAKKAGKPANQVTLPFLNSDLIDEARENFKTAERTLKALRKDLS